MTVSVGEKRPEDRQENHRYNEKQHGQNGPHTRLVRELVSPGSEHEHVGLVAHG